VKGEEKVGLPSWVPQKRPGRKKRERRAGKDGGECESRDRIGYSRQPARV
jgi:hypothetical protein